LQQGPWKELDVCNVVPGAGSGGPAGGGWGSGLGTSRVRFGGSIACEELPEGGHAGGRRRWPPRLPVRRGGASAGREKGAASYGRSRGGGGKAALARGRPGKELAAASDCAPADSMAAAGRVSASRPGGSDH
jgi:hypothetical protein